MIMTLHFLNFSISVNEMITARFKMKTHALCLNLFLGNYIIAQTEYLWEINIYCITNCLSLCFLRKIDRTEHPCAVDVTNVWSFIFLLSLYLSRAVLSPDLFLFLLFWLQLDSA